MKAVAENGASKVELNGSRACGLELNSSLPDQDDENVVVYTIYPIESEKSAAWDEGMDGLRSKPKRA